LTAYDGVVPSQALLLLLRHTEATFLVFGRGLLLKMSEAGMGLMAGVGRCLSLLVVFLLLPAIVAAQRSLSVPPFLPQENHSLGFTSDFVCEPQGANRDPLSKSRQGTACYTQYCDFLMCSLKWSSKSGQ
jgi:hypothetical protein